MVITIKDEVWKKMQEGTYLISVSYLGTKYEFTKPSDPMEKYIREMDSALLREMNTYYYKRH